MTKIVLNVCYGGYGGWSKEAAELYLELSGKPLKYAPERDDPFWVETVERLGDAASDHTSRYAVFEYDGERFSYNIQEYDGLETVCLSPIIDFNKIYGRDPYQVWSYLVGFGETISLKNGPFEDNKLAAALTDKKICETCPSYGKTCGGRAGAMRNCDLWIDGYHNMQKQLAELLEKGGSL